VILAMMIKIEKASKEELIQEYEKCQQDWGKYSYESFGHYITALHTRIVELGGWS
jgi:hypothetical protein